MNPQHIFGVIMTNPHLSLTNHIWRYDPPDVERIRHFQSTIQDATVGGKSLGDDRISMFLLKNGSIHRSNIFMTLF